MRTEKPAREIPRDRGYWGVGLWRPKKHHNVGTLLRNAHAFGAAFIVTIGPRFPRQATDTARAWRHLPVYDYETADEFFEHLPYRCRLVAVELGSGAIELPRFAHPEQALYLLGAEDDGLPPEVIERADFHVQIPAAAFSLNVASAGTVVMYDRIAKRWSRLQQKIDASGGQPGAGGAAI